MTEWFRVTVEDLQTGQVQSIEVAEGDYVLNTFGDCELGSVQRYSDNTLQLMVKNHDPAAPPRYATYVDPEPKS